MSWQRGLENLKSNPTKHFNSEFWNRTTLALCKLFIFWHFYCYKWLLEKNWIGIQLHPEYNCRIIELVTCFRTEISSDQVVRSINVMSLKAWVGQIPDKVLKNIRQYAPMLPILGYDLSTDPKYGEAEKTVLQNSNQIRNEQNSSIMSNLPEQKREMLNRQLKSLERFNLQTWFWSLIQR